MDVGKTNNNLKPYISSPLILIITGVILSIFIIGLWVILDEKEKNILQSSLHNNVHVIASYANEELEDSIMALNRLADRWKFRHGMPKKEFENYASGLIRDFKILKAIEWVDENYIIKFVVPLQGNQQAVNMDLKHVGSSFPHLQEAVKSKSNSISPPIDLVQGGKGFIAYFPIFDDDIFKGVIQGVISIENLLNLALDNTDPHIESKYKMQVEIDGVPVHFKGNFASPDDDELVEVIDEQIINHHFRFSIIPLQRYIKKSNTHMVEIAVSIGISFSILLIYMLYLFQKVSAYAWKSKKHQQELVMERRRLTDILEGTNVGTWEWYVQTGEVVFNQRWAEIIGYTLEELSPITINTWQKFAHPDDIIKSNQMLEKVFKHELDYYEVEVRMKHKNGSWIWILDRGKVSIWDEQDRPILMSGTHQDINQRKLVEAEIQHQANHDVLTNLPTLRLAYEHLQNSINHALRENSKLAVLFVDLDKFKHINDNYGHEAGDILLKQVADRLKKGMRKSDIAARIGGDEFLIILTEIKNIEDARLIAKNLLHLIAQPMPIKELILSISASIGIAIFPENANDPESLIRMADEAMYKTKRSKPGGYTFA